jgi:hypothetical protein
MENYVIFHNQSPEIPVGTESWKISNASTDNVLFELNSHLYAHVWELEVHYGFLIPESNVTKTTDTAPCILNLSIGRR